MTVRVLPILTLATVLFMAGCDRGPDVGLYIKIKKNGAMHVGETLQSFKPIKPEELPPLLEKVEAEGKAVVIGGPGALLDNRITDISVIISSFEIETYLDHSQSDEWK